MDKTSQGNIPRHIAIIMDGNGRWARERGYERFYGHINGVESIRRAVKAAADRGVEYLTVYAFSTENWGRPQEEVNALMELVCESCLSEAPRLKEAGVRMRFIGNLSALSDKVKKAIRESESATDIDAKLTLLIAINYSSRDEITQTVRKLAAEVEAGRLSPSEITEQVISDHLYTAFIPDPDLLIRTSGERRLSNFLLWQSSYSEFFFLDIYWPDFTEQHLDQAIEDYRKRQRRYGLINK